MVSLAIAAWLATAGAAEPWFEVEASLPAAGQARALPVARLGLVSGAPEPGGPACAWFASQGQDLEAAEALRAAGRLSYLVLVADDKGPRWADPSISWPAPTSEAARQKLRARLEEAIAGDRGARVACGAAVVEPALAWIVGTEVSREGALRDLALVDGLVREVQLVTAGKASEPLFPLRPPEVVPVVRTRVGEVPGTALVRDGPSPMEPELSSVAAGRLAAWLGDASFCPSVEVGATPWSEMVNLLDAMSGVGLDPILDLGAVLQSEPEIQEGADVSVSFGAAGVISGLRFQLPVFLETPYAPGCTPSGPPAGPGSGIGSDDPRAGLVDLACRFDPSWLCTRDGAVLATFHGRRAELGACHAEGIDAVPGLRGYANLEVDIDDGRVTEVRVRPGLGVLPEVAACWAWIVEGWKVPWSTDGTHEIGLELRSALALPEDDPRRVDPSIIAPEQPFKQFMSTVGSARLTGWVRGVGWAEDLPRWWDEVVLRCGEGGGSEAGTWSFFATVRRAPEPPDVQYHLEDPPPDAVRGCIEEAVQRLGPSLRPSRYRITASWAP